MIINVYMDKEKDKDLIDWLNSFTNRSSAIRMFLYQAKQGHSLSGQINKPDMSNNAPNITEDKPMEIDSEFIAGLNDFK